MISGAGDPDRARLALEAVDRRLIRREDGVILLFDPPFDAGPLDPGYIKGYLPGIRENGGQYTHAATWVVLAFARSGRGRTAFELFNLLNPIRHADSPEAVDRYKVEPYVVAADVYGRAPHVGRGGWTWYTGSASWLYRVALEAILGFRRAGDRLTARSVHPRRLAGLRADLSPPDGDLPDRRDQPARGRARHPCRDPRRIAPARSTPSRSRMTAASTRSRWSWDRLELASSDRCTRIVQDGSRIKQTGSERREVRGDGRAAPRERDGPDGGPGARRAHPW